MKNNNNNKLMNGVRILNLEGADILKDNIDGLYIQKEYKGVFPESLLLNLGLGNRGLKINSGKTRDIITVEFGYGFTPSEAKDTSNISELEDKVQTTKDSIENLKAEKKSKNRETKKKITEQITNLKEEIKQLKIAIKEEKERLSNLSISKESVRDILYKNGFHLTYEDKNRKTGEITVETINYRFWFRTPSKSRVGDVIFINEKLYNNIKSWQRMGLKLPVGQAKIVEMGAYESLTSSHIEDTIVINPDNILVVNDIDSIFNTNCAKVFVKENGECDVENGFADVKNTLFDGQALMEDSLFSGSEGMMLLRQHFFKACAFRTKIQEFMKEWCLENQKDYETFTVNDKYNNPVAVKNILMITTENAMKWEKFTNLGASFNYWKQKVNEDGNIFGICKRDHESKFGDYQRMSYQMINTLDVNQEEMDSLAQHTIEYINKIKNDNELYLDFLEKTASEVNPNAMLIDLCKQNKEFVNSRLFRTWKKSETFKYIETIQNGKLLVEGDNLTIVGNPYTMLLHSVGQVPVVNGFVAEGFIDPTLPIANEGEDQYISVYTKRFKDGEYLAAFRNPHNSPNNAGYHKCFRHELMEKYFNFSKNIMAVNMIQTEEQSLKNGEDMDSDFNFVTNSPIAVLSAKRVFRKFACIVNDIPTTDKTYENTIENYALIDNELASAKFDIGLSSNLAQLAMSWYWNDKTEKLADIVAIMSVLAQCSIDNAKRQYSVNIAQEIKRISNLDCMKHTITNSKNNEIKAKPYFWQFVSSKVKEANLQKIEDCNCPMNFLQKSLEAIDRKERDNGVVNTEEFIREISGKASDDQMPKIKDFIKKYDDAVKAHYDKVKDCTIKEDKEKWLKKQNIMQNDVVTAIAKLKMTEKTMQMLVLGTITEDGLNIKYKKKLLNALYKAKKDLFLSMFI